MKNRIKVLQILGIAGLFALSTVAFAIDDTEAQETPKKQTRKEKKLEKEKQKYSRYTIPTENTIIPNEIESDTLTIEGSVAKSLELNLADCLKLALTYNPTLKAQYAESAAVKTLRGQALSNWSPTISATAGLSRLKPDMSNTPFDMEIDPFNHYTAGEISVKELIYDFGITQNLYKMRKIEHEESLNNIETVANNIICQVKTAYYLLVTAIEKERVMVDTVSQFEQTYAQAKAFYDVGVKPKIDVTIAATNLADARAKLIQAQNDVVTATATLNNAMGLPFIVPYTIDEILPYEEFDTNIKELIEIANENRPALKNSALSVKEAEQAWKLSKNFRPVAYVQGAWGAGGNSNIHGARDYWNFGGYLGFNSINPFLLKNQIDEQRHRYEKQQFVADGIVNDIYYEIQTTWAKLLDARDRVPVAELSMQMAKENYELASGRYKVGESDAIELKDAQIQYQNSRLAYYNTLYEYNREKANLEKAVGQTLKNKS